MNKLITILQLEIKKYKQLKTYTEKQKNLLMENNNEAFPQTVYELEHLMNEVGLLEKSRQKEIQQQGNNIHTDDDIVKIKNLTTELGELAKDIKQINECNELLLKKKMEFIQFNVNVMTNATADVPYQSHGNVSDKSVSKINIFDKSI